MDLSDDRKARDRTDEVPAVTVYHDFRYHPKEIITGGFDTWMYEHMGSFAWTIRSGAPSRAGIGEYKFIDWYREHAPEKMTSRCWRGAMRPWMVRAMSTGMPTTTLSWGRLSWGRVGSRLRLPQSSCSVPGGGDRPVPGAVGVGTADLAQAGAV